MSSVAIRQVVNLMSKSRMQSMDFTQTRTYFYSLYIDTGKGFVNASFRNMTFTRYTGSGCSYGGLFVVHKFLKKVFLKKVGTLVVYVLIRVPSR